MTLLTFQLSMVPESIDFVHLFSILKTAINFLNLREAKQSIRLNGFDYTRGFKVEQVSDRHLRSFGPHGYTGTEDK
ncbi:hypothetical protein L596_029674 [Steinernema carpocapsae]|uniref:Uncharacterized protein n=1 Tax=Steinernema carpocapsae TaxID=34508 RepID=A0A4U5LVC3_STECR|nr:hypothetical protein L596_029674 [Steinernema carpocapsae]